MTNLQQCINHKALPSCETIIKQIQTNQEGTRRNKIIFFSNRPSVTKLKPNGLATLSLYHGGFSQTLSSNTLRNSNTAWSFPKADRFIKIRVDNNAKVQLLPSTLNFTKYTNFGYGQKNGLQIREGIDSPPPNTYKLKGMFERIKPNTGKSFGISHQYYQKVYLPDNRYTTTMVEAPGPGTYDQRAYSVGSNSLKFTLKPRIKQTDSATRYNPPPNNYHPNFQLTEQSKFQAITFGFGSRINVNGQIKDTPGPGTYKISSIFDRFKRLPAKQYLMLKTQGGVNPNKMNDDEEIE